MDASNELNSPILPPEMEIAAFVVFICVACTVLTLAGIVIGLSCLWRDDPDHLDEE